MAKGTEGYERCIQLFIETSILANKEDVKWARVVLQKVGNFY